MLTDPFVALAVAATAAPTVEVGTAVLQLPLYQPLDLAHRLFSLHQIAGDRFKFGVGAGSTEQDFRAFERDYATRFRDFTEGMQTLRTLLETGQAEQGALSPWAAVQGGPPIYYGTWGHRVEVAAREYDGWIASGHYRTVEEVCAALGRYRGAGGGRAIVSTLQVTGETDLGAFSDKLARFAEAGFDDAVVMLLPGSPSPDEIARLLL